MSYSDITKKLSYIPNNNGIYGSFFMSVIKRKNFKEIIALSLFCMLLGIFTAMLFKNNFLIVREYKDVFSYQVKNLQIDKSKIFLSVLCNRIVAIVFIYISSGLIKSKYYAYILSCLFFYLYGIYFFLNCLALGLKGFLTGMVLCIPQWFIYILACVICVYYNNSFGKNYLVMKIIRFSFPVLLIIMGALVETYVTLPLVLKIF